MILNFNFKLLFPLEGFVNYVCNYSNQADIFVTWGNSLLLVLKLLFELHRYVDKYIFSYY